MTILFATQAGVYRAEGGDFETVEHVLDSEATLNIASFDGHGTYAASKTGLYHTDDAGSTWSRLSVPRDEVYAVTMSPDCSRIYAGTHPAHLYVSLDGGTSWQESLDFQELPSRDQWHTPRHRGASHVRSLGVHPDVPGLVVAGVEVGGVHVSHDYGETWHERRADLRTNRTDDLQFDVHHVLVLAPEEYLISCGGGLYHTSDAGHRWTRLAVDPARWYFQEAYSHDGTWYVASQTHPPWLPFGQPDPSGGADAGLYESVDRGATFRQVDYPGGPDEFVYAWAERDGQVVAGTTGGRVLVREDTEWTTRGFVPAWIRSMTCV